LFPRGEAYLRMKPTKKRREMVSVSFLQAALEG
jgi:hypothetical protein